MSDSQLPVDDDRSAHAAEQRPPLAGDDLLPPIEPPSAKFIVQLFVVPALIVFIVVAIWVLFSWLVHRTTMQPDDLIQGLRGSSVARWQRASELADMLRNERYKEFRENGKAAADLAEIFSREIDAGATGNGLEEQNITLRFFLARALGEFRVDEGLDVLVKAATTNRDPREAIVRRGALQALAVRAHNLAQLEPPRLLDDPALEAALTQLVNDDDRLVRSETAFALGQIGTPASINLLGRMVLDPHADTRYNAAVALARHGNPAAVEVLAEMLDPAEMASVDEEPNEQAQFFKRSLIISNALEALDKLRTAEPNAELEAVVASLERLVELNDDQLERARISKGIVPRAREALEKLRTTE